MSSLRGQSFATQLPPSFDATPSSVKANAEKLIAGTIAAWDLIVSQVPIEDATFQNTIVPIFQDENAKSQTQRVCEQSPRSWRPSAV
jgi:metallopeptidase MepB